MGNRTIVPFGPQHPVSPSPSTSTSCWRTRRWWRPSRRSGSCTAASRSSWRRWISTSWSTWRTASAASAPSSTAWPTARGWRRSCPWRCPPGGVPAHDLVRACAPFQPPPVARPHGRCLRVREPFHAELPHPGKDRRHAGGNDRGRIILGVCRVGGVRRDVPNETLTDIVRRVKALGAEMRRLADVFLQDDSVKHRLAVSACSPGTRQPSWAAWAR